MRIRRVIIIPAILALSAAAAALSASEMAAASAHTSGVHVEAAAAHTYYRS